MNKKDLLKISLDAFCKANDIDAIEYGGINPGRKVLTTTMENKKVTITWKYNKAGGLSDRIYHAEQSIHTDTYEYLEDENILTLNGSTKIFGDRTSSDKETEREIDKFFRKHNLCNPLIYPESKTSYSLTKHGNAIVEVYLSQLQSKRKEILDAGKDTADDTELPAVEDILADVEFIGLDDDNKYINGWAVTDNYDADYPLLLKLGKDLIRS